MGSLLNQEILSNGVMKKKIKALKIDIEKIRSVHNLFVEELKRSHKAELTRKVREKEVLSNKVCVCLHMSCMHLARAHVVCTQCIVCCSWERVGTFVCTRARTPFSNFNSCFFFR